MRAANGSVGSAQRDPVIVECALRAVRRLRPELPACLDRLPQAAVVRAHECVADAVPTREAVVCRPERETYAELDERASRLAHALRDAGVGIGDHVGLYLRNSVAHVETMLACYKARAVPINVNYRYVAD